MIRKVTENEIVGSFENLPVLSEIVRRAMEVLDDPDCSIRQLADIVGKDQSISARMIKIANSAFYGHPRQIKSIPDSIVLLGFKKIRSILITASAAKLMNAPIDGYMIGKGELWKHSFGVGFASGLIAKIAKTYDSDEALTAGVLHDIGKLVLGNFLKDSYDELLHLSKSQQINFTIAEKRLLGYNHAEVGAMMLEKWNFPQSVCDAVAYHHEPQGAEQKTQLIGILYLADNWVNDMNVEAAGDSYNQGVANYIVKDLKIDPSAKEQVQQATLKEFAEMDLLFPVDSISVDLSKMSE
jgi:putative nucleotidyltransferase with HDIG domain